MFSIAIQLTMPLAQKCEMYQAHCFPPISGYLFEIVIHPSRAMIGRTWICCQLGLFWSIHTCLHERADVRSAPIVFNRFWRVPMQAHRKLLVPVYRNILREEVGVRDRDRGFLVPLWVRIRMEDCIFDRDVLKLKNTPASCTWFNLRRWRAQETTTTSVKRSRSFLRLRGDRVLVADQR